MKNFQILDSIGHQTRPDFQAFDHLLLIWHGIYYQVTSSIIYLIPSTVWSSS